MITATFKGKMYDVDYSVVNVSELEGELRLDAEYYEPYYLRNEKKIRSKKWTYLNDDEFYIKRGTQPSYQDEETGFYALNSAVILDGDINFSNSKYVSEEFYMRNIDYAFEFKDVLVNSTGIGTLGRVAIVLYKDKKGLIDNHITRIRLKRLGSLLPEYIFSFLRSLFGQFQIERLYHGSSGQIEIYPYDFKLILIPILSDTFQKQIEKLVLEAYEEKEKSVSLYKQAEDTLLEELGLKDWKLQTKKIIIGGKEFEEEENISIRNLSEVLEADRMDAEYFQTAYEDVIKKLREKNIELQPLRNVFDFRRGVFVSTDYYTEEKTNRPYIRIKELTGRIGINEDEVIYVNDAYREDTTNKLYEDDLVIAIIGDTIGKANRIYGKLAGGFCSNNTGRLRIKANMRGKIIPEYVEILFQSFIIQSQIEKKKAQTGQPKIADREIKSMIIPILPLSTQQKIASLVQQSHEARKKAKELLEVAKRAVEIAIEKNEKEALDYIAKVDM